jgi:hypothetical protein
LFFFIPVFQDRNESLFPLSDRFVFKEPEKISSTILEIPEKTAHVKKPKKSYRQTSPTQPEKIDFITLPIEPDSIVLAIHSIPLDTLSLLAEMEQLKTKPFAGYHIRKFHIPPAAYKFNPKDLILPLSLITVGAIASNTDNFRDILPIERVNPQDRLTPFDDVFQHASVPALFVYDAIGQEKHHPVDQFFLAAMSYGIMVFPVRYIKGHYNSSRPYGGNHSFPSGHTASAFICSHIIYKEFKDSDPLLAYSGYSFGVITAGLRVAHDKHWVSDVVAGAGFAILATELAYFIYFPIRNLITDEANKLLGKYILLSPAIDAKSAGLNVSIKF